MARTALITGVTGQDGAYLARLLRDRDYRVVGTTRGSSTWRLRELGVLDDVELVEVDLRSDSAVDAVIGSSQPDEVYNLASVSSVGESFERPVEAGEINGLGAVRLLEAVRCRAPGARFYQASSSEMFGRGAPVPQTVETPLRPSSPYAASKAYAHQMTVAYREAYGLFACCGILFNHESPLRGSQFVTRKIARGAARIAAGLDDGISLGNLSARRDFGYAPEYVAAMWAMLQQDEPRDCVVATGTAHSIEEFAVAAFAHAGLRFEDHVHTDPALYRPTELDLVVGDPQPAARQLGWSADVTFDRLVPLMVDAERERLDQNRTSVES